MIQRKNKEIEGTLTRIDAPPKRSEFDHSNVDQFQERMKRLVKHFGSIAAIAQKCGFAESTVKKWVDGISDPSRARCVALARGTGVSLLWIVAGEDPMWEKDRAPQTASHSHSQPVSLDDLTIALQLADEALEGRTLPRAERAELSSLIYEMLVEGLPEATVLRFARAARK